MAAGLSGDPALTTDFLAGDPHMGFAIRVGLAPPGATKTSHGDVRDMVKPISLGSQYGMSKYGAAAQAGFFVPGSLDALPPRASVMIPKFAFTSRQHRVANFGI